MSMRPIAIAAGISSLCTLFALLAMPNEASAYSAYSPNSYSYSYSYRPVYTPYRTYGTYSTYGTYHSPHTYGSSSYHARPAQPSFSRNPFTSYPSCVRAYSTAPCRAPGK